jgi:hypothetical protein
MRRISVSKSLQERLTGSCSKFEKSFRIYNHETTWPHLQEKSSYEKIHTKYCKTVLGLKKTACNISTLSELGRLPIASFIKTQVMMYFVRINTNNINPLIKESLNVNKSLHRFSSRLPIYLYLKNKFITDPS